VCTPCFPLLNNVTKNPEVGDAWDAGASSQPRGDVEVVKAGMAAAKRGTAGRVKAAKMG